jgi:hypothetical protein
MHNWVVLHCYIEAPQTMLPVQLLGADLNTNLTNKYHRSHRGIGTKLLACKGPCVFASWEEVMRGWKYAKAVILRIAVCACVRLFLHFPGNSRALFSAPGARVSDLGFGTSVHVQYLCLLCQCCRMSSVAFYVLP